MRQKGTILLHSVFLCGLRVYLYHENTQEKALLRLHCNNGYANAQQCYKYFIRTFLVLIYLNPFGAVAHKTCGRLIDKTPFYKLTSL